MSIFDKGSWVKPNLSFEGNEKNSSLSTESKINLAAEIVLLVGSSYEIQIFRFCKFRCALDRMKDIFPSNKHTTHDSDYDFTVMK